MDAGYRREGVEGRSTSASQRGVGAGGALARGADFFDRAAATDFFGVGAAPDFFFDGCAGEAVRGHGAGAACGGGVAEEAAGRGKSVSTKSLRMPSCGRSCL